ncbi:MAG: hypothetical protein ACLQU2_19100 [Candidatus Binataceae bacterium]
MTAASVIYSLGTTVRVTDLATSRPVVVPIDDKGPSVLADSFDIESISK